MTEKIKIRTKVYKSYYKKRL